MVYVHAFNFQDRYLWESRIFSEALDFNSFFQVFVSNVLMRFGLPLFFMRAGYLMAESDEKYTPLSRIQKKAKTLLVPYVAWSSLGLLLTFAFESIAFTRPFVESSWLGPFNNLRIAELDFGQWMFSWLVHPISFQLWFLRNLFLYACLFPGLLFILKKYPWPLLIFLGLCWFLGIGLFVLEGEGLFFFTLGIWVNKTKKGFVENTNWIKLRYLAWLPLLMLAKTYFSFEAHHLDFFWLGLMHKIMQPCLLLAIWKLYDVMFEESSKTYFLDNLSRYTFFVYGFHVPVLYYATDMFHFLWGRSPETSLTIFIFLPPVISLIAVLFGFILRNWARPVYLVFTGFRENQ